MASVTYGKCYLWQKYYGKCNYGKSIMANETEPLKILYNLSVSGISIQGKLGISVDYTVSEKLLMKIYTTFHTYRLH